MKILNTDQIRELDSYTIDREPIESIDLMERAAQKCTDWLCEHFDLPKRFVCLCGPGNNGGDGLAIARQLIEIGRDVRVYAPAEKGSPDNRTNYRRLEQNQIPIHRIDAFSSVELEPQDIIIDALFGSGLSRPLEGFYQEIAVTVNKQENIVIGIDIPSGMFADAVSAGVMMQCDFTLTFQCPKLAFFVPENQDEVGEWVTLDIGLHTGYLNQIHTPYTTVDPLELARTLPARGKYDHKGTFGHAFLIAGSFGKIGAAILAAKACLRTGAGLLTVHVPRQATTVMHVALPEAMISTDKHDYNFSGIDGWPKATAVGIGCGLGLHECTTTGIRELLKNPDTPPLVIDADGLNTISKHPELIDLLPQGTILTPHLKEFARLFGVTNDHFARLDRARSMAMTHKLVIVLKGAHTAVISPEGHVTFNTTGNPGMATAGSGDVLTGMITGLLAQGMAPESAARLGVFLHGLAGDIALEMTGAEALIASDIISNIGHAFQVVKSK